ncbi:MAG: DUF3034 family protein [Gammaproteobacteria bacterium]
MVPNSIHRPRRKGWRFFLGITVVGGLIVASAAATHAGNRLLATGGVMQLEGSAGGGLTPWALIAGLGTDRQVGASAFCTSVNPQDFQLRSCGMAFGIRDRVELSYARQRFDLDKIIPDQAIGQSVFGAKVRLFGDAVFDQDSWYPQVSAGLQYKKNSDFSFVPQLLGARDDSGVDYYVAATKVYLAGPFSRMWLVNATLRATNANQLGILGFGGDRNDSHKVMGEGSVAAFLTDSVVLGAEYRQKPNNLSSFEEDDYWDGFAAWFPTKYLSMTAAYADLGNIAMKPDQRGWYLSLQGSF